MNTFKYGRPLVTKEVIVSRHHGNQYKQQQPHNLTALKPYNPTALQPYSLTALQPYSLTALQPLQP